MGGWLSTTSFPAGKGALLQGPIACHEIDRNGKVSFVNEAECVLLGLSEGDIVGRYIWDFVAPDQRDASREAVRRKLAAAGPLPVFERNYLRPDGQRLTLEIHETYLWDSGGQIAGIRSFLLNTTQRKLAEEALRDSEQRYRRILEQASDIIYHADLQGRFLFVNTSATRLLGYTEQELLGRKYLELIRP